VNNTKNKLIFPRISLENVRYMKTNRNSLFCQKVVFKNEATFVLLCSQEQLKLVIEEKPKQFFVDGFHKTPKDFTQMISMFAYSESKKGSFCVFHCLINSKSENDYQTMIDEFLLIFKTYYPEENFYLEIITTDFELALLNSLHKSFSTSQQSGCFFHWLQCQIRSFGSLSLLKKEVRKTTFQLLVLMSSLCFINPDYIPRLFTEIKEKFNDYEEYFDYFERVWIKGFEIQLWNYYNVAENFRSSFKITNNILESFHSLLLHLNNNSHRPSLSNFVSSLAYIESRHVNDFNQQDNKPIVKV